MRTLEGVTAAGASFLVVPRPALLSEACALNCRPHEANEAAGLLVHLCSPSA